MTIPTGAAWRDYLRALAEAGIDVASVGAWVAAAELPPARRRLARGVLTAATLAVSIPGLRAARSGLTDSTELAVPGAGSGLPFVDVGITLPTETTDIDPATRRRAVLRGVAVLSTAVAVTVGAAAAGRRLERRWLARLVRNGHPRPHRALAVRMTAAYAALVVPGRLLAVRKYAAARP